MRVTVRLFARLRDIAGTGELTREAPAGANVGAVWASLVSEFPELSAYGKSISCAVNADYSRFTAAVADGDEVAFPPPVSCG
jgi:sulfur-carrier protein